VVFEGSPYYTMHKSCDEWHFGLTQDEAVGDKALAMLDRYRKKPFFFFVHFAEVDHSGHKHGEPSKEYNDAIISGDRQLGRIVEKLKQLGLADKTLIYVTADHGFDVGGKGHRNAPYVFLGTNDKQVARNGARADITPTILDRLGVDLSKLTPPLDGESLAKPATKPVGSAADNPDRKGAKKPAAKPKRKRKAAA
jgi:arylsulfatase A-like enzyme